MIVYESHKKTLFGKLLTREQSGKGVSEHLPWCYRVDFTFFTDDSEKLHSGSEFYLSTDYGLHEDAIVRWYYDNEHLDGEVSEVTLFLNKGWNNYPTYLA